MSFLKVEDKLINLDLVTYVDIYARDGVKQIRFNLVGGETLGFSEDEIDIEDLEYQLTGHATITN